MNRLVPSLLATTFFVASAGLALAATPAPSSAPAAGQRPASAPAAAPAHKAHPQTMAAARREDRADPKEARITHALNLLEANGYGQFSGFKADGKDFDAMVTANGQHFPVVVDPDSNQITRKG